MLKIRRSLTYANVAATLALVFALSGTSYALIVGSKQVLNNSLTSTDIKDNTIKATDLATASVGSAEVIDGSLKVRDLNKEVKGRFDERAFAQQTSGLMTIPAEPATVMAASMGLAPGNYVAIASVQLDGGLSSPNSNFSNYTVTCTLRDPEGLSTSRSSDMRGEYTDEKEVTLVLAHNNTGAGLQVECNRVSSVELVQNAFVKDVSFAVLPLDQLEAR